MKDLHTVLRGVESAVGYNSKALAFFTDSGLITVQVSATVKSKKIYSRHSVGRMDFDLNDSVVIDRISKSASKLFRLAMLRKRVK